MNPGARTGARRARAVRRMFDGIAGRYDPLNRLMTFGQDRVWIRQVVDAARLPPGGRLLDVGTGTGAIAAEALRRDPLLRVAAADFSVEMMRAGRRQPGGGVPGWCGADALSLPFRDRTFDAVTSGYLLRNVTDIRRALAEQLRVLRPGGRLVCLDTSPPPPHLLRPLVRFHLRFVIPLLGRMVAGQTAAYRYLPESTRAFLPPRRLAERMRACGLTAVAYRRYMFGTIAVLAARRPAAGNHPGEQR